MAQFNHVTCELMEFEEMKIEEKTLTDYEQLPKEREYYLVMQCSEGGYWYGTTFDNKEAALKSLDYNKTVKAARLYTMKLPVLNPVGVI